MRNLSTYHRRGVGDHTTAGSSWWICTALFGANDWWSIVETSLFRAGGTGGLFQIHCRRLSKVISSFD